MAFFRNSTVNLLNLHYGIHQIAQAGGAAFVTVFLLKAGVPAVAVLLTVAMVLAGRFAIRPIVIPLAVKFGIRNLVILGTVLSALPYPILAEVHGIGFALLAFIVVGALGDAIYWTCYHAYFAALGDAEHRGHQLGAREALAAIVGIVSPIASGWLLITFGPQVAFGAACAIGLLAAVPLLFSPNIVVARHVPGAYKAARFGMALFVADGWICAGYITAWQITLFVSLGQSFLAYGGALAIAALAGAVAGLFLGRYIDGGGGRRAAWLMFATFTFIIALRSLALGHAALAITANALGALGGCIYVPTMMTAVYNEAKRSPCVLRFHMACEGAWDIGGALGMLAAAGLVALGAPISAGVALAFCGLVAIFILLRRYYATARITVDAAAPNLAPGETASAA